MPRLASVMVTPTTTVKDIQFPEAFRVLRRTLLTCEQGQIVKILARVTGSERPRALSALLGPRGTEPRQCRTNLVVANSSNYSQ
jgi:glycerol-3-phosphate O-acyltransferase